MLPLFGPGALASAEPVRCVETMKPLSRALGLPVTPLPELGEEHFQANPEAGLAVVERLLADDGATGPTVICSQGGVIPSVLLALGVHWHGTAGALWPPSAKGSIWTLAGRAGALAADYYRDVSATS